MAKPEWPAAQQRAYIGKRIDRVDGPVKCAGVAKYSYDVNRPGMLWAKVLGSPHAHAQLKAVDLSAAEKLPGVEAVWKNDDLIGDEVVYIGQVIAAVAARTEEIAAEAIRLIKVDYDPLPIVADDTNPEASTARPSTREEGNAEEGLAKAEVVTEGRYGLPVITHCCMEAHGQVTEIRDGELYVWPSTQNVSGYRGQLGEVVGIPQNKIHVECQYMGGGFGSKFNYDKWGEIGALFAKQTGKPIKLMLDRDLELMIAGNRPSAFAKIKVGATRDGRVTTIDAEVWGTGGSGGYGPPPIPYVFTGIPNQRTVTRGIRTNRGGQRAWRAPGHPQGCLLTMAALDDMAAALKMDALEFFLRNLDHVPLPQDQNYRGKTRREAYREELKIAADLIGYKQKAHLRGESGDGPVKRGLGIAMHTWGGMGHNSECDVTINADGSVEAKLGSQDLGTGTRTTIRMVVAETFGIPLDAVEVKIGRNEYPPSGGSGGSTTIGGVSASSRLAATDALNALFEVVGKRLGVSPDSLEARDGQIRQVGGGGKSISWQDACRLLGPNSITKRGINRPNESQKLGLIDQGVGGVQMADVSVDTETGVVTVNEIVAVQDCGLIVDLKTAESQVYGALIMGVTYALYEEAVYDKTTGAMLNADMEFYRLAGLKDIGRLRVHMMTGEGYDERGVIGLGEPPVISPGAAISNAVANAVGVRVPYLPLTPDRVLTALQEGGVI